MEVFESGESIGTVTVEQNGLFLDFFCKITKNTEQLRRIFVQKGWQVEYLGIPDASGTLTARIPAKHLPAGGDWALTSSCPKGEWLPWRGELDGVSVENGYIKKTGNGISLAMPLDEGLKFPAWAEEMYTETVLKQEMIILPLTVDGQPPAIDREMGGHTNEENDWDALDPELPIEPAAYDDNGGEGDENQGWEADRPDL